MSEKENTMPDSTTLRQENDINRLQASNVKQLTITKEKTIKNVMNQPGLKAANLNQFKKVEKESKSGKKDTIIVKTIAKEIEIERVRHSPLKGEALPLFIDHERKSKIHIHHKSPTPAVQSPILPTIEDTHKLKDKLKATDTEKQALNEQIVAAETEKQALNEQIEAAETVNQEKTKKLSALRLEAKSKTKQLTELDQKIKQINEYKARHQSLKMQEQEQQEMYKELVEILSSANEAGMNFEQELQPREDEINDLLNQISEVNYRILELKEAKE